MDAKENFSKQKFQDDMKDALMALKGEGKS